MQWKERLVTRSLFFSRPTIQYAWFSSPSIFRIARHYVSFFFSAPFVAIDNPSRKRRAIISVEQQRALVSAAMLRFSREPIFPRSIPWKSAMFARLLFAEKSWRGAPRYLGRRRSGRPSARTDWTRPPSENTSGPSKIGWERKTWGPVTWSDGLTVRAYLLFSANLCVSIRPYFHHS